MSWVSGARQTVKLVVAEQSGKTDRVGSGHRMVSMTTAFHDGRNASKSSFQDVLKLYRLNPEHRGTPRCGIEYHHFPHYPYYSTIVT